MITNAAVVFSERRHRVMTVIDMGTKMKGPAVWVMALNRVSSQGRWSCSRANIKSTSQIKPSSVWIPIDSSQKSNPVLNIMTMAIAQPLIENLRSKDPFSVKIPSVYVNSKVN